MKEEFRESNKSLKHQLGSYTTGSRFECNVSIDVSVASSINACKEFIGSNGGNHAKHQHQK